MDNRPIGVFDSGLGGLTVVRELRKILPNENIVYFGDTGRVPYGTRSRSTITRYTMQDITFLKSKDVKMIVVACGTASSVLTKELTSKIDIPITGVIQPAAQSAASLSHSGTIGVIGTTATIRSGAYGKAIHAINPTFRVVGKDCPLFVPLVENGMIEKDNEITSLTAKMYLKTIKDEKVDTLILGCTHYPLIYDIINEIMDYSAVLIDPGKETAHYVQSYLTANDMLNGESSETANIHFYVSDTPSGFESTARIFLGEDISGCIEQIDIENLTQSEI